jgi:Right handed beta helix region
MKALLSRSRRSGARGGFVPRRGRLALISIVICLTSTPAASALTGPVNLQGTCAATINTFWWTGAGYQGYDLFRNGTGVAYSATTAAFDVYTSSANDVYTVKGYTGDPPNRIWSDPSNAVRCTSSITGNLQAAITAAAPGDNVYLRPSCGGCPSTYGDSINITNGGTVTSPITIARGNSPTPVLSGRWQIRAPYITVSRLIFDGGWTGSGTPNYFDYPIWVTTNGCSTYGSNFTLDHAEVKRGYLSGVFVGDAALGQNDPVTCYGRVETALSNVTVTKSYVHDNGHNPGSDHGIYVKTGSNHSITGNLITNNNEGWGIQNYPCAQNVTIQSNEIDSNGISGAGVGTGGVLIEDGQGEYYSDNSPHYCTPQSGDAVNHTLVDSNYTKNNLGLGIKVMYQGDPGHAHNGIVNTISNNCASGNAVGQYGSDGTLGGSTYTWDGTWVNDSYGNPCGTLISTSQVGPDAP